MNKFKRGGRKIRVSRTGTRLCLTALFGGLLCAAIFSSCNVVRQITNESQYHQRGDTSVVIQTKTIETYNAQKNN